MEDEMKSVHTTANGAQHAFIGMPQRGEGRPREARAPKARETTEQLVARIAKRCKALAIQSGGTAPTEADWGNLVDPDSKADKYKYKVHGVKAPKKGSKYLKGATGRDDTGLFWMETFSVRFRGCSKRHDLGTFMFRTSVPLAEILDDLKTEFGDKVEAVLRIPATQKSRPGWKKDSLSDLHSCLTSGVRPSVDEGEDEVVGDDDDDE